MSKNEKITAVAPDLLQTEQDIRNVCDELKGFLIEKNRRYGNSALWPLRIFSRASKTEQLQVRIDDKLSRISNNKHDLRMNDTVDLMGYLVLLCVAMEWTDFEELID